MSTGLFHSAAVAAARLSTINRRLRRRIMYCATPSRLGSVSVAPPRLPFAFRSETIRSLEIMVGCRGDHLLLIQSYRSYVRFSLNRAS